MDVLDSLKDQWLQRKGDSHAPLLEEYGVSVASWILANLDHQVDVENVLSSHVISNPDLLDHCGWEIIPMLYRREWMQSSPVRDAFLKLRSVATIF